MNRNVSQYMEEEEEEYHDNSPENSQDSPPSAMFNDSKITPTSSPRKSRRGAQKRVVSVPINEVEKSKFKGEMNTPPSDSWAWRKYGQKPIKGSPYPRGYYRCSSSKGCPARKQVERSKVDPTTLLVTYSCEHNHPWPASRKNRNQNQNNQNQNNQNVTTTFNDNHASTNVTHSTSSEDDQKPEIFECDGRFTNFEGSLTSEFGWFSDLESTSSTLLESPLLATDCIGEKEMTTIFSMGEEDESLFADLGELPECSLVFRRDAMEMEGDRRWCSLTSLL